MAMEKTGYTAAIQGTTKVNVALDEDGYIAPSGTLAVSQKRISINQVNADNSLADNTEVLNFFLDLANGRGDSNTNVMQVTWGV